MGREVVKLVTPGTLIEPLDQQSNYLMCVSTGPSKTLGLAWIDISTSEFQVASWKSVSREDLGGRRFYTLYRYHPLKWKIWMKI